MSLNPSYLFKGPISKYSPILIHWELGLQEMNWQGTFNPSHMRWAGLRESRLDKEVSRNWQQWDSLSSPGAKETKGGREKGSWNPVRAEALGEQLSDMMCVVL
jgi:hypothetical protein